MDHTTLIDAETLAGLHGDSRVAAIDCRFDLTRPAAGRAAYLEGHVAGARHANLNEDLSAPIGPSTGRHPLPDPDRLAARLATLGVDAQSQVIAYDDGNGAYASRLWWLLRWIGHHRVAVLDGGYRAWIEFGGPIERGEPRSAAPASLAARPDRTAVVGAAEVAAAGCDPRRLIVDARAAERFRGAVEPLDRIPGHVPGARNFPFTRNLGEDGRFLPPAELKRRWQEFLRGVAPSAVIAMCGSGVTACHNLLAMQIAGLPGAALYAGSYSEWVSDPARPVATGPGD